MTISPRSRHPRGDLRQAQDVRPPALRAQLAILLIQAGARLAAVRRRSGPCATVLSKRRAGVRRSQDPPQKKLLVFTSAANDPAARPEAHQRFVRDQKGAISRARPTSSQPPRGLLFGRTPAPHDRLVRGRRPKPFAIPDVQADPRSPWRAKKERSSLILVNAGRLAGLIFCRF
jgi:transposase-like protein